MGLKVGKKQISYPGEPFTPITVERKDPPFQSFMSDLEKNQSSELLPLLNKIKEQGERLAHSLTVKDLRAYKQLVQQFIREMVAGSVSLKSTRVWHRPQSHAHSILKVVDQKLMNLTNDLLKKDVDRVAVLEHLGEIKGLLIDLYQ